MQKGLTLIEVVVSIALLLVVIVGAYQGYAMIHTAIAHSHFRMTASDLANEHFETIRNLPYVSVGTVGGTPSGTVITPQTLVRGGVSYTLTTVIQNVNDPFDGGGDAFPADYKLVEVRIACQMCKNFTPVGITGQIAPLNLENS